MTTGADFIVLAGNLAAGKNPTPAALRTAINRAYYGAMHLTRQFLASIAIAYDDKHNLRFLLCNCGNRDAEQAGKMLEGLLDRRMRADYKLERLEVESLRFAQDAVEMAHEFRAHLDRIRAEPACTAVKSGIEAYRRLTGGSPRR